MSIDFKNCCSALSIKLALVISDIGADFLGALGANAPR